MTMTYVLGLKCKECGHRTPVSAVHVCEQCFGPYEVEYDYAKMKGKVTRESIAKGPKSLWRYRDLLPVDVPRTGRTSVYGLRLLIGGIRRSWLGGEMPPPVGCLPL